MLHFWKNFIIVCIFFLYSSFFTLSLRAESSLFLNQEEKTWLSKRKKPIKVGITMIPNQILISQNGDYLGFSMELFHLIEKKIGISFQYIYFKTWNQLITAAKQKEIDIVFSAQKTFSRLSYLDFTDTVLVQQNKIIVNMENDSYRTIETLLGHTVAVTSGSAIEEFLRENYPKIILVDGKNEQDVLTLLSQKKVDAAISELVRASYYIKKYNLAHLHIAGDLGYDYHLRIASGRDDPMLNVILSKAISHIPKEKIEALQLKWGYIKDEVIFFDKQMLIYLALVFGTILPFSFYLYRVNRRLEKEIMSRKAALEKVVKMRKSRLHQMSEIVSMIAHQWKQPLNNLSLINMQLILKYKKGKLNDDALEYFQNNSQRQIALMTTTIDDFKDFFKVEEEKKTFNVRETIQNLLSIVKPIFDKDEIYIFYKVQEDEALLIEGYTNALLQIFLNIVNNAKDAFLEQEIVKKRYIKITAQKREDQIIILLEDNAGGIPKEILEKVFDPYFSTKKKKNGTGLGLYMAKTILEDQMNGQIDVSNGESGACFKIELRAFS